jgi:HK97 family phage portal protein
MGILRRLSTTVAPARIRGQQPQGGTPAPWSNFWYTPEGWLLQLNDAGIPVTPELSMTLSAMHCGVSTIGYDLATVPLQAYKYRDDGGKDRVRPGSRVTGSGGIGWLAYRLRWQPNNHQSATEFWLGMVAQYLLRGRAYAEIVAGPNGAFDQLLPRHPDRITQERSSTGRILYRLTEISGPPRIVTDEEMLVVRDLSLDGGMSSLSRVQYGANAIGTAMAARKAQARFFKSGMTAAVVGTYKGGELDEETEADLHASVTRYAAGVENSFGFLLIPDDVTIANLGIEPDKAQMMLAQEWGVKEVARFLRIGPTKLGVEAATKTGKSLEEENAQHATNCLRPVAVLFEQAIHRDLVLAKDTYFFEFLLEALMRGNATARAAYYKAAIEAPWMWPSEVRVKENMNPDEELDALAKVRYRPGTPRNSPDGTAGAASGAQAMTRGALKATLAVHANAIRCLRRERAAVAKLAQKHASDVDAWKRGLRDFYADHAGFVAETMRLHVDIARGYAAQHGTEFAAGGAGVLLDDSAYPGWERCEADELAWLALSDGGRVDEWVDQRASAVSTGAN